MTRKTPANSTQPRALSARRLALLASVAGLGAVVLFAGPGFYRAAGLDFGTPSARAAETTLPHPVGFADIVAKVKPAVISVRVKIGAAAEPAAMQQNGDDETNPFAPGSPLDKFFQKFGRQFGDQDGQNGQNGMPQRHQIITGEGSGFFISPRWLCGDQQPRRRSCQIRPGHDRRRHNLYGQGRRHRPENRSRPDQGRRQERLSVREVRRPRAAGR